MLNFEETSISQTVSLLAGVTYHLNWRMRAKKAVAVYMQPADGSKPERRVYYGHTSDKWLDMHVTFVLTTGVTDYILRFEDPSESKVEIDDICLTAMLTPLDECSVYNPSFGEGLIGWSAYGQVQEGVWNGRQSVKIRKNSYVQKRASVVGGVPYELAHRIYGHDRTGNTQVELLWRGPSSYSRNDIVSQPKYPKAWIQERIQVIAPTEATIVYIRYRANNDDIFLDDVCWKPANLGSAECLNINTEFDFGTAGYSSGSGAVIDVRTDAGNNYLNVNDGWVQTRRMPIRPSEEYFLNFSLREILGAEDYWVAVKWSDASYQLIREEPLPLVTVGNSSWTDREFRLVAPDNAAHAQILYRLRGGEFDLDNLCFSAGVTRAGGCTNDQDVVSYWTRTDPGDGGAFEETFYDGYDALSLERSSVYTEFIAEEGHSYSTRFRLSGSGNPATPSLLRVEWLSSTNTVLSTSVLDNTDFAASWAEYVYRAVAPAGAVTGRVYIENSSAKIHFALYCSMDAGAANSSSVIAGVVWADDDADGVQGALERPLGGAKMVLYEDNGDGVRDVRLDRETGESISSRADLEYFFTDLPAGDYYIVGYLLPTKRVSPYRVGLSEEDNDFEAKSIDGISVGMTPIISTDGN